jgi:acetyltransferase-like isoleucine patch superfamily enzyme
MGMLSRLLPKPRLYGVEHRLRLRLTGYATVHGPISRLRVSKTANLSDVLINTRCGSVEIGDYVFFGHDVLLLTGTHDFRRTDLGRLPARATADRNIVIEQGAWIASRAIIMGPCRIGRNAVVGCGCIVDFDVPPDTVVRVRQEHTMDAIKYLESQPNERDLPSCWPISSTATSPDRELGCPG